MWKKTFLHLLKRFFINLELKCEAKQTIEMFFPLNLIFHFNFIFRDFPSWSNTSCGSWQDNTQFWSPNSFIHQFMHLSSYVFMLLYLRIHFFHLLAFIFFTFTNSFSLFFVLGSLSVHKMVYVCLLILLCPYVKICTFIFLLLCYLVLYSCLSFSTLAFYISISLLCRFVFSVFQFFCFVSTYTSNR